ncbi:MAG: polysaccharide biosynthesis/export family protein [Deltaproteobacteria bacterium]|nr:polysaccharide biosynthesis/export family protein [Deltaproteobacteria bacterium]
MNKQIDLGFRISDFGINGAKALFVFGLLVVWCFFSLTGCANQIVQGEKETKGIVKEELPKKGNVSRSVKPPDPGLTPREDRKVPDEKERLGNELERAVTELKANVLTLKRKLDEDVAQNAALFKKDPPEYKIRSGDVIEIIYHMLYEENPAEYLLEVQDSVKIEFFNQPDMNRTVSIRSDGKVTLPLIGDIPAAGLSSSQLEQEIIKRYKKYLIDPNIAIYLERFNVKIDELKKAITTAPRGQSKISPVRPDGRTSFPFIGDIKVAGLTVEEVRKIINEKYRLYVRNLEVTVVIERVVNPTIFVSGEVNGPGDLTITGPLYLSQVISRAKGLTPTADGKHVMVIRRFGVSKPVVFHADLDAVLIKGDISKDVILTEDDMVYVPRASRHRFFICGEVNVSGVYPIFPEEPLTLSQAISMANGIRMTAALDSVMILRRPEGKNPQAFRVNFKEVLANGDMSQDILIQKNDVIFVPKTFITKVDEFIEQWFTRGIYSMFPAGSTLDFIIDLDTVRNLNKRTYGF